MAKKTDCRTIRAQDYRGRFEETFNPDTSDEDPRSWLPLLSQPGTMRLAAPPSTPERNYYSDSGEAALLV